MLAPSHSKLLPIAPATVLIGPGVRAQLADVLNAHGPRVCVVTGAHVWPPLAPELEKLAPEVYVYAPDCTEDACARAAGIARGCDVVLGVGGGKAMDLAKLVGHAAARPVVNLPTSAATCAAWTGLGNFYDAAGAFQFGRVLSAPAGVVVDTELIARAPARLLASGLADTLAKWVETSASVDYAAADQTTRAAYRMARFLYDEILEWGREAYADACAGRLTPTLSRAIETNICLAGTVGGLGGERCRSVAAHAVHNALTQLPGHRASWHGEKVGFGILAQLLLEGREAEARALADFFAALELPLTTGALGVTLDEPAWQRLTTHVCRPESTVHHLPFPVSPARVREAIAAADALGRAAVSPSIARSAS
ncbi:MAG TPA: iron-containing alcohol dehydrogenase family protein [Oscillatoriaceae cyanobacterium]